jgi:hypothetical protein
VQVVELMGTNFAGTDPDDPGYIMSTYGWVVRLMLGRHSAVALRLIWRQLLAGARGMAASRCFTYGYAAVRPKVLSRAREMCTCLAS